MRGGLCYLQPVLQLWRHEKWSWRHDTGLDIIPLLSCEHHGCSLSSSHLLVHSCKHTHTHTYAAIYSFVLVKHLKGVSWPLAATLSRNNRVDVVVARQPLNKWACGWLSTLSGLCCQLHETLCTNMHTLPPPYQCFSCLCSSPIAAASTTGTLIVLVLLIICRLSSTKTGLG